MARAISLIIILSFITAVVYAQVCTDPGGGPAQICVDTGQLVPDQDPPHYIVVGTDTYTQTAYSTVNFTSIGDNICASTGQEFINIATSTNTGTATDTTTASETATATSTASRTNTAGVSSSTETTTLTGSGQATETLTSTITVTVSGTATGTSTLSASETASTTETTSGTGTVTLSGTGTGDNTNSWTSTQSGSFTKAAVYLWDDGTLTHLGGVLTGSATDTGTVTVTAEGTVTETASWTYTTTDTETAICASGSESTLTTTETLYAERGIAFVTSTSTDTETVSDTALATGTDTGTVTNTWTWTTTTYGTDTSAAITDNPIALNTAVRSKVLSARWQSTDDSLYDVTGFTFNAVAGKLYRVHVMMHLSRPYEDEGGTVDYAFAIGGTATVSGMRVLHSYWAYMGGTDGYRTMEYRRTNFGDAGVVEYSNVNQINWRIDGVIYVASAGTILLRGSTNCDSASVDCGSIEPGSYMQLEELLQ